jgi:hypothetical protein
MSIFDVIGGVATGAGEGIETGLRIKGFQEGQDRADREQDRLDQAQKNQVKRDLIDAELRKAQVADYQRRGATAAEEDRAEKDRQGQIDIQAAEYLHRYPDLAKKYGTDFRPGGRARTNIDAIIQAGTQRDALAEEQRNRAEFPGLYGEEKSGATDRDKLQTAFDIYRENRQFDPTYTFDQAMAEVEAGLGGEAAPDPGSFTDEQKADIQETAKMVVNGELSLEDIAARFGSSIGPDGRAAPGSPPILSAIVAMVNGLGGVRPRPVPQSDTTPAIDPNIG